MRFYTTAAAAALAVGIGAFVAGPASAQISRGLSAIATADHGAVQQVQYYHRRHRGSDAGAFIAGGIIGLAAGAIAAGAAAPPPAYYYGPAPDQAWIDYCFSKYRSFDPASGTYLGYDGKRHYCR